MLVILSLTKSISAKTKYADTQPETSSPAPEILLTNADWTRRCVVISSTLLTPTPEKCVIVVAPTLANTFTDIECLVRCDAFGYTPRTCSHMSSHVFRIPGPTKQVEPLKVSQLSL
jgi:hypothetical protein